MSEADYEQRMNIMDQRNPFERDESIRRSQADQEGHNYKELSVKSINESRNGEELIKYFEQYKPQSQLNMRDVLQSDNLKLKKYKECVYFGGFVNGKRQGKGVMLYHNGRVYEGDWQADFKHGEGYQKFVNDSKYNGAYVNGKPEGVGTYVWPNGELYEGEWINGLKHGSGMWRGAKGDSYIGEWKFGKADGYGVHTWVNGDRYQGEFKACLKHGEGTQKFANGDIYIGSYVNGKPSGYGEYYWVNGSFFKGNFKNGLRHGNGVWKRNTGNSDKYEGEYANDKKCGYGIFTWASGNVYKGNYFDDMRHGYGQMYWTDNSCYKGNWEKGIQHGQGEITMPGEPPKRGIFEENVLIAVDETHNYASQKASYQQNKASYKNFQTYDIDRDQTRNIPQRVTREIDRASLRSKELPIRTSTKERESLRTNNSNRILSQPNKLSLLQRNQQRQSIPKPFQRESNAQMKPKQKIPTNSVYILQMNKDSRPYSRNPPQNNVPHQPEQSNSSNIYRTRRIQTGSLPGGRSIQANQDMKDNAHRITVRNPNSFLNFK